MKYRSLCVTWNQCREIVAYDPLGKSLLQPPRAVVRHLLVERNSPADLVDDVADAIRSVSASVRADRMRQVLHIDQTRQLEDIEIPILYLAANRDRLIGQRGLAQFQRHAQDLSTEVLDAPHLLLQTRPVEAIASIQRWLERHPAK